jgi:hypothetical protein
MTALAGGVKLNAATGLLEQTNPVPISFGVAQNGKDMPSTVAMGMEGEYGQFETQAPSWAGESPQFVGLDQVNVAFPTCKNEPNAAVEKRYDAFLTYTSMETGTTVRIYLPFIVRPGDPDCQFRSNTATTITSNVSISAAGQPVTFSASVSPSVATGTVTFVDGNTPLTTVDLSVSGGVAMATFTTTNLSVGTHSITVTYNGNSDYGPSSSAITQIVRAATTTSIASSANPSIPGQSLSFTATVSPSDATGTVTFFDGTMSLGVGTLIGGQAMCGVNSSCSTSYLAAGSHSIKAVYNGDTKYGTSSGTLTQMMTVNTVVTVTSSANPATSGQSVTFIATVGPWGTGTVTFYDGTTMLGSAPLALSPIDRTYKATFSTSGLTVGSHSITARYSGDANTNGSTSTPLTETAWAISLSSSPNPSSSAQMVTFTACGIPPGVSGTVSFMDGTKALGTNNYLSGPCTSYSTNALVVGAHSIIARYSDSSGGNTSATVTQTVKATATTTSIASSANPSIQAQSLSFTATVSPSAATGTVTFFDGTGTLGVGTVAGGKAMCGVDSSCPTSSLGAGNHSITAVYSGDSNYSGSTSNLLTLTVNSAPKTSTASTLKVTPNAGHVILSAVVSPSTATGVVTFTDNGSVIGSATLSAQPLATSGTGQYVETTACLGPGNHTITANYGGNTNYNGSASTPVTVTGTSMTITSTPNPATAGEPITLTAIVSPTSAGGTVSFVAGAVSCSNTPVGTHPLSYVCQDASYQLSNGQFKCITKILPGTQSITAVYDGGGTYAGSTATLVQTVQ